MRARDSREPCWYVFFHTFFTLLMITYRPSLLVFFNYNRNDDRERKGRDDGNEGLKMHVRLELRVVYCF